MVQPLVTELRSQIRGITGALLVLGLAFLYTMETWRLGWILPLPYIVGFSLVGLVLVMLITRNIGFHEQRGNHSGERNRWVVSQSGLEFASGALN